MSSANRLRDFQQYGAKWGLDRYEFYAGHKNVLVVEKGQSALFGYRRHEVHELRQLTTLIRRRNNKFTLFQGTGDFKTVTEFKNLRELQQHALMLKLAGI